MSLKNAEKQENNRVKLEIEVDAETFKKAVDAAYKKDIKNMTIPGFRKGKAPRAFVEKIYGTGVFYETAVNSVYPDALDDAIKASGYEYVEDKIDFDVTSVGEDGLKFTAVITVKPEVTLDEYKGLKATKKIAPVTDEDVEKELTMLQERNSRMVAVDARAADKDAQQQEGQPVQRLIRAGHYRRRHIIGNRLVGKDLLDGVGHTVDVLALQHRSAGHALV